MDTFALVCRRRPFGTCRNARMCVCGEGGGVSVPFRQDSSQICEVWSGRDVVTMDPRWTGTPDGLFRDSQLYPPPEHKGHITAAAQTVTRTSVCTVCLYTWESLFGIRRSAAYFASIRTLAHMGLMHTQTHAHLVNKCQICCALRVDYVPYWE